MVFACVFIEVPALAMAASGSLCSTDEEVLFFCEVKRKTIEICASRDVSAVTGYMQYRVGINKKLEFVYPLERVPPVGKFRFNLLARAAQLTFQNDEFTYTITEPLAGKTEIWVSQANAGFTRVVECRNFTDSLTLTTIQNRFKRLGIYE